MHETLSETKFCKARDALETSSSVKPQLLPLGFHSGWGRLLRRRMENKHLPERKAEQQHCGTQHQTHVCGLEVSRDGRSREEWWMLFVVAWESRGLSTSDKHGLGILCTVFMLRKRDGVKKEVESEEKHQWILSYGYILAKMINSNPQEDRWQIWEKSEGNGANKEAIH